MNQPEDHLKKSKSTNPASQINKDIWPIERDLLFRPDRLKYVRKLIKPAGCVFCLAEASPLSLETLCLYKSQYSMILLNKYPYNTGHLLVLPRRHCGDLLSLTAPEYEDWNQTLKLAFKVVQTVYSPNGVNIGLNHGSAAGAGIPDHLHYHLVPRWSGDLNFFPLIAETKVIIETVETSYKKLQAEFSCLSKALKKPRALNGTQVVNPKKAKASKNQAPAVPNNESFQEIKRKKDKSKKK